MINVRRFRTRQKTAEINMSPLIDLVFLLLIFFIVTTSFVKETGVDVDRPCASSAVLKERGTILIGVSENNDIFFEGRRIDVRSVRMHIAKALAENPEGGVIIVSDKESSSGVVIRVLDQCRLAGATDISIAASKGGVNE